MGFRESIMASKKAVVIGSGFGGLTSAALLAKEGFDVTVLEKNESHGGRARVWEEQGFVFDMGPSWYLMPEVFDRFFALFGKRREDYYTLKKLDPYYQVFFEGKPSVRFTSDRESNRSLFDSFEKDGGKKLEAYLSGAKYKYDIAMEDFLYREYRSVFHFFNCRMIEQGLRMNLLSSLDRYVSKYFSDTRSRQVLEYAMVFLGASPQNAPALYSIMSHVDLDLGVWYPEGGMGKIVEGLMRLGAEYNVEYRAGEDVQKIETEHGKAVMVHTLKGAYPCDVLVANADYAHVENRLLERRDVSYPPYYWKKKVFAPSMFIAYLGVDGRVDQLTHHNLYFQSDWKGHFDTIFKKPAWPEAPCYYLSAPSRSDPTVAPAGKENLFLLVPIAPGLPDTADIRDRYFDQVLSHVESTVGISIRDRLCVKRIYTVNDYRADYNAYQGSALGMAHTLDQTAVFRPSMRSRKVKNLYFSGQYTHPGVGVPMTLIASEVICGKIAEEC